MELGSGHEELRERDKRAPDVEYEIKKPRKSSLKLQETFYLLVNCLFASVNLKILF